MPTETVYGLAGNARSDVAVARIFEAKGRPAFDPLIIHIAQVADLTSVAIVPDSVAELVETLSAAFWPGPFTMVLPKASGVSALATSGLDTVAVRCTAHPGFSKYHRACGIRSRHPARIVLENQSDHSGTRHGRAWRSHSFGGRWR
ncbi:MAG: threonylcarbamoyl-AMP synthase, partial [Oscillochloris sp.]|nr:threonylcarbamoyl-AMP synthase [Oscillochloris sp.]